MTPDQFIKTLHKLHLSDIEDQGDLREVFEALMIRHHVYLIDERELDEYQLQDLYADYGNDLMDMFMNHINNQANQDYSHFHKEVIQYLNFEKMNPVFPEMADIGKAMEDFKAKLNAPLPVDFFTVKKAV